MGELGRQAALFANADGLGNAVKQAQALFAHIADIHAAEFAGDTRQINLWVPPGYDEGCEVGVTVYLLDGTTDQDFGHVAGLAGLFVTDTLLEQPGLFNDYIAISPHLWWDGGAVSAKAPEKLSAHDLSGRRLCMAMCDEGGTMQTGIEVFRAAMDAAAPANFEFAFSDKSASETHATIYHSEALAAFRRFYALPPWEGEMPW